MKGGIHNDEEVQAANNEVDASNKEKTNVPNKKGANTTSRRKTAQNKETITTRK